MKPATNISNYHDDIFYAILDCLKLRYLLLFKQYFFKTIWSCKSNNVISNISVNGTITSKNNTRICKEVIQSPIQNNQGIFQKTRDANSPKITECTQSSETLSILQPESPQVLHKLHSIEIEIVSPKVIQGGVTYFYDKPLQKDKDDTKEPAIIPTTESTVFVSSS